MISPPLLQCVHPVSERAEPGVDPRVARLGTSPAPGDNTNLTVSTIITQNSQRSPAVSLTGISAGRLGADHGVSNHVVAVGVAALLAGDGGEVDLLQSVSCRTGGGQETPPSHQGGQVFIVLPGLRQADRLHS